MKNIKILSYFLKLTYKLSKSYIPRSILVAFFKALSPFLNIIIPKFIIDELFGDQVASILLTYVVILIGGNFILRVINKYFETSMEVVALDLFNKFDTYLGNKCVDMDFENIENPEVLDLKEKAFFAIYNFGAIGEVLSNLSKIIYESIVLIGLSYLLFVLNPLLILCVLAIVAINALIFKRVERLRFIDNQRSIFDTRAYVYFLELTGDFTIAKDIRLYNGAKLILKKARHFTDNLLAIYGNLFRMIGKYTGITKVNIQVQMVFVYGYLVIISIAKKITIGEFTMYANAVNRFSSSFSSFIEAFIAINQDCNYLELFVRFDSLESKNDKGDLEIKKDDDLTIKFEDVSFKYPNKDNYVLRNVSIKIKPGEKLSVVGLNGAGKTTFIKLLARLYEPTEGKISIGGKDIRKYKYEDYMDLLAIVFQDFKLLSYTIKENLAKDCHEEYQVYESLKKAGFSEDLKNLDKGIHTNIYKSFDEEGIEFSGGQAQKIAIGRALYKDAPIVILDEPTSALDPVSEYEIYNSFNNLVKGKTAIYISHRLSSTRFSDNIAVFNNGKIVEYGPHNELVLAADSLYADMYFTQAGYYID